MKKVITLSITSIFCFVIAANAQINKGSIMLGGTIYGSGNNVKNPDTSMYKTSSFTIAPALGFAVNTNTILGFSLSYGTINTKYNGADNRQKLNAYGVGAFLRKYKLLAKNFYLFGEGNLMYNHSSYNYSIYNSGAEYDSKANSVSLNFTPGIAYNLTPSIQLETGLQNLLYVNYSSGNEDAKDPGYADYKQNSFSAGTSLSTISLNNIFVGIRFWINK